MAARTRGSQDRSNSVEPNIATTRRASGWSLCASASVPGIEKPLVTPWTSPGRARPASVASPTPPKTTGASIPSAARFASA